MCHKLIKAERHFPQKMSSQKYFCWHKVMPLKMQHLNIKISTPPQRLSIHPLCRSKLPTLATS